MLRERTPVSTLILLTLIIGSLFVGCARPANEVKSPEPERRAESTPIPPPPYRSQVAQALISPTPTPPKPTPLPPPGIDQIRDAVARIFEKAATPDSTVDPGFVVGDFNGDRSQDLAVVVKASEASLGEINNELANWILEDPRTVLVDRNLSNRVPPNKPVHAEKGDNLLAIIHGVGAQGWRAPEAKQTFLLKNGAGSNLRVQSAKDLRNANGKQRLPPLKGDAISETIGAKSGLVFWTGAKYAWYPSVPN